jgi:hypothetical protein
MAYAIMRTAKLKGGGVSASDMHTERERETPNADEKRTENNIYLVGEKGERLRYKVDEVIAEAQTKTSRKIRRDAVECVEFLMTASPEHFRKTESGEVDMRREFEFYDKCGEFMEKLESRGMRFVKAVAHRDETTPHIVAYAVPLDENGRLNCKSHLGGKQKLKDLQDEFAEIMEPLGLERGIKGSVAEHQTIQKYYGKVEMLDEAIANKERAEAMMVESSRRLQTKLDLRETPLVDFVKAFAEPNRLVETSGGLTLVGRDDPTKISAIITPDNKAFAVTGDKISDGSSLMLLTKLSGRDAVTVTKLIADRFGSESAAIATENYAKEIVATASRPAEAAEEKREFNQAKITQEVERAVAPQQQREINGGRSLSR